MKVSGLHSIGFHVLLGTFSHNIEIAPQIHPSLFLIPTLCKEVDL